MDMKNNYVVITGMISNACVYNYTAHEEDFYKTEITVTRTSGTADVLPVIISDKLFDPQEELNGRRVKVTGEYRSYNLQEGENRRLKLFIFAQECEFMEDGITENNHICLNGYICKQPVYRRTPLGRDITDLFVAVNRPNGQSDYIPCIVWGRSARWAERLKIGTEVKVIGRVQSREYSKQINEDEYEQRIAYEVSVNTITKVKNREVQQNVR